MSARRGSERRRFVRVHEEVVAAVRAVDGSTARDGRTLNFSAGGVLLESESRLAVGTTVEVELAFDEAGRPVCFPAEVVRVRTVSDHRHELALEFVGGSAADQRALVELIERRLPPLPDPTLASA